MITTAIDPPRKGDGLTDVRGAQCACRVGAKHGICLQLGEKGYPPFYGDASRPSWGRARPH
ncbi:hypothetical protein GCM10023171_04040 [Microbacterium panaciterrae]|uniref:Uncharacterized protein n=1 Tax=Microbacterium panaciterrae TaxID=985759 RepID=A0ABP8P043_9MICO